MKDNADKNSLSVNELLEKNQFRSRNFVVKFLKLLGIFRNFF